MLETLLATIGVMLAPILTGGVVLPGGFILSIILGYLMNLGIIIGITIVTNIIRAFRYCRDEKGEFSSYGIFNGVKKGLLCGSVAIVASIVVSLIPVLRIPFTIISFIPGLASMIDGFILAFFYLLSYIAIAYPVWGSC